MKQMPHFIQCNSSTFRSYLAIGKIIFALLLNEPLYTNEK